MLLHGTEILPDQWRSTSHYADALKLFLSYFAPQFTCFSVVSLCQYV